MQCTAKICKMIQKNVQFVYCRLTIGDEIMRACASVSGGVMFIPDELEYKSKPTKYSQFLEHEGVRENVGVFGKKKKADKGQETEAA